LTGAATGDGLWGAGTYSYDQMGNMTALGLGASRTAAFSYNGTLPTLASVVENGVARAIAYDAAGNEVAVGSGAFSYSPRNLLAVGDGLAYTYDGRGVRVAVQVAAAFGTITGTVNATSTDGAGSRPPARPRALRPVELPPPFYSPRRLALIWHS
jgi:hypothetical protein